MYDSDLKRRADQFATSRGIRLISYLGGGTEGDVWKSNRQTAVKAFKALKNYGMEIRCYQRLRDRGIRKIREFEVPRLVESDRQLLVIEMNLVSPPCLIDFGKAYVDEVPPEHSAETWAEHIADQQELWEDKYNEVQAVLWSLKQIGIYYRDAKPGNIMFAR